MDRDVAIVSACGIGILAIWVIRSLARERAAAAVEEAEAEKASSATARAVQESIKARR
jgi:hypothetical protein